MDWGCRVGVVVFSVGCCSVRRSAPSPRVGAVCSCGWCSVMDPATARRMTSGGLGVPCWGGGFLAGCCSVRRSAPSPRVGAVCSCGWCSVMDPATARRMTSGGGVKGFVRGRSLRPSGLEPKGFVRGRSLRPSGLEPACGAAVAALHQFIRSLI